MKKSTKTTASKKSAAAPSSGMDAKLHTDLFAKAMKKFGSRDYEAALELFEQASSGPQITVNESARMYCVICKQRLGQGQPELKTAEDLYNFAVAMINQKRYTEAAGHLQKALQMSEGAHIRYALALANGLEGDMPGAVSHLQKAIQLDPRTRSLARNDSDFKPLLGDPAIRTLVAGGPAAN